MLTGRVSVFAAAALLLVSVPITSAGFVAYDSEPAFRTAGGGDVPKETFDSYDHWMPCTGSAALHVVFEPMPGAGDHLVLWVPGNPDPTGQLSNYGSVTTIPGSTWVIHPEPGFQIYGLGYWDSSGYTDYSKLEAFDIDGNLVGGFTNSPAGMSFGGFISTTPIATVVITPLGDGDFLNGWDDLQVIVPEPAAAACLLLAGLAAPRRRRT